MIAGDRQACQRVPGFLGRVLDAAGGPVGTCFQVAPGVLVTAWHVLDGLGKAVAGAVVGVDRLSGGDPFVAQVLATDPGRDLAVLRSSHELPAAVAELAATDTVPNQSAVTVVAAGEVDDHDHTYRFIEATGEWQGATVRDDLVALGRFRSRDVLRGMSGAPVCLQPGGAVVGVLSGRYNSADGWLAHSAWVSRTEYLAELLHGVLTVALLDVSSPAVGWRERRAVFLDAMTRLARGLRDAFLVGSCGPPFVDAFVRRHDTGDRGEEAAHQHLPAAELLAMAEDCWLAGGPGAGKSRLLRSWTIELAGRTTATTNRIPVLVRAAELAAAAGSPTGPVPPLDSVAAAVNTGLVAVGRDELPWLADWFTGRPVEEVEWVVLVDGLDEVTDVRLRNRVFKVLAEVSEEPAWRCRVIVASRPWTVDDSTGAAWLHERYDLVPFEDTQRDELVRGWFAELALPDPERAAQDFVAELHRRGLHQLARIPLMLVILGQLFTDDRTLPASRVGAYERIVEETHRRRPRVSEIANEIHDWHDEHLPAAVDGLHDRLGGLDGLLSRLAFERFRGRASSAVDWVCAQTQDLRDSTRLSEDHWRDVVREALWRNRLLVAHGRDFEFVHATFYEFFAARHLARDLRLSEELLRLIFARRGEWFSGGPRGRRGDLIAEMGYGRRFLFIDWVFAFWSDWPPFTTALFWLLERDPRGGCALVASLFWRRVRLNTAVVEATRANLRTMLADSRSADLAVSVAELLAMAGDPAGLLDAARNPQLGLRRITAAEKLVACGDSRGPDLLAEATEAVVTAPEPSRFTDREAEERRRAAWKLVRRGHPRATDVLRRFLLDPRTDDGRTRRYTFAMLGFHPKPREADVVTRLLVDVPVTDPRERRQRSECVAGLLRMDDPGCADRLAMIAAAAATVSSADRARAAVRLADLGDPRAADLLAELTDDDDLDTRQEVAWALARLGDPRAVAPLVAFAGQVPPITSWPRQVRTAATNGNRATAEVLVALAEDPNLPAAHRCVVLQWLTLTNDPRGIEHAARAASDPRGGDLFTLADALARRHDRRFTTLLARWADQLDDSGTSRDEERGWAARVLASPEEVLGDGLLANYLTTREINQHRRHVRVWDLFTTDHPRALDCLVAMHREFEARTDIDDWFRRDVVDLLVREGSPVVLPLLAERVRDTNRHEYEHSEELRLLTKLDCPEVTDTLVSLASHVTRVDRWDLADKLLAMDDPRAGAVLAEWLITETQVDPYDSWDWKLGRLVERRDPHVVTVLEHLVAQHFSGDAQLSLTGAIDNVASVGGPRAANLLAQWAMDSRFTTEHRIAALRALATIDAERATDLRQNLADDPNLTPGDRELVMEELVHQSPPRSHLEAVYRDCARTPSDILRVQVICR